MNTYLEGSLVTVATYTGTIATPVGGFRDATGTLADPTTVVLKYKPAGQPVVTVTYPSAPVVKDATGLYHADLDTTGSISGAWEYEWKGTGAVQAPADNSFLVKVAFGP